MKKKKLNERISELEYRILKLENPGEACIWTEMPPEYVTFDISRSQQTLDVDVYPATGCIKWSDIKIDMKKTMNKQNKALVFGT
ncbi:hypothetical protein [Sulfuricurvum sp.]|uniref:hypothetical protein n=1 Tax=Sulfuricurvum sp. TaxID=2025608 RepID=UPI0035656E21